MKFFFEGAAGHFVDKTEYKKFLLGVVGVLKIVAGIIMVSTTNVGAQIVKGAIDGVINSLVTPATTALTLGAVGKTKFHRKHAQLNIMVKNLGVSLSAVILGLSAWAIYPDIQDVFYQFIAVGVICLVCVFFMPSNSSIDHNVARGQSIVQFRDNEESDSDDDEEGAESNTPGRTSGHTTEESFDDEEESSSTNNNNVENRDPEYTEVISIRDMFGDPTRRQSLIYLALTFFSYHLVNATVLPLLGQYIGTRDPENGRDVLPSMAGLIVMKELGSFFTNWFIKSRLRKRNYKTILSIGCCVLLLRMIAISILMNYTNNLWALGSTNILEGVGIGCLDLVLALYTHLLSMQTGHYNLNMGIVGTFKTLGSALSVLLGGALATTEDYNVTFPILTVMVLIPLFTSTRVHTPDLYGQVVS